MTNPDPHLNTTEVRQGNKRKMNARVLIFGLIAAVIVLGLAIWFFQSTYDDTETTTGGGATLEDAGTIDDPAADEALDALPTPAPTVTTEGTATPDAVETDDPGTIETAPVTDTPVTEQPPAEEPAVATPQ